MVSIFRIIVFAVMISLIEFYFLKKVIKAIKNIFTKQLPKRFSSKIYFWLLIAALNVYPVFLIIDWSYSLITGASVLIPENSVFDYLAIYPFWIFFLTAVQCDLIFLLIDIIKLLIYPLYKKFKSPVILFQSIIVLMIFIAFVFYVPARIIYDYNTIEVRQVSYRQYDLPSQLNNFKIAFISDIHADRYTDAKRLMKFVSLVNEQKPNLVLAGGDFISSTPKYIYEAAKYTGKIKAPFGIYSCVGDHDNWAYRNDIQRSLEVVTSALSKYGVEMIDDSNKYLNINGSLIKITFITNTYVRRTSPFIISKLTGETSRQSSGGSSGLNTALKILVIHQPEELAIADAGKNNYNLLLAGHTHGGQITFLFPFKNLTPTMFETKYIRGNFHFGNMLMVVTRGLGMSLVPLRYNSTPEITIINIRK